MNRITISNLELMLYILIVSILTNCAKEEDKEEDHIFGSVTDYDGNTYKTIQIGNQTWMAENLKVTHFRNGDPISEFNYPDSMHYGASGYYENNVQLGSIYGRLYNWYAVDDPRKLAPEDWHIPSKHEWEVLKNYLGSNSGGKVKEKGYSIWDEPNEGATNESGFTALPGGMYIQGGYSLLETFAYFWTSEDWPADTNWAPEITLSHLSNELMILFNQTKDVGFSVRCIKD